MRIGNTLPAGCTEEVLGSDAWVAEKVVVGDHGHEVSGRHGRPAGLADVGVINQKCGGDDGL